MRVEIGHGFEFCLNVARQVLPPQSEYCDYSIPTGSLKLHDLKIFLSGLWFFSTSL
jgi:hypothetical protein